MVKGRYNRHRQGPARSRPTSFSDASESGLRQQTQAPESEVRCPYSRQRQAGAFGQLAQASRWCEHANCRLLHARA